MYLTGAPATGKTTVGKAVCERSGAGFFSYGAELTLRVADRAKSQSDLRRESAGLITPDLVQELDAELRDLLRRAHADHRAYVVDSHAVTKEQYGFRAIPFDPARLVECGYSQIVCLYASAEVLTSRIQADPDGRPLPSPAELDRHVSLQSALALTYAHTLGVPVAFIDSGRQIAEVVEDIATFCHLGPA